MLFNIDLVISKRPCILIPIPDKDKLGSIGNLTHNTTINLVFHEKISIPIFTELKRAANIRLKN